MAYFLGHWELRGFGQWALVERDGGRLVGRAGLLRPEAWPGLEVGWLVARDHWGRGFAPEAGRASLEWARGELGADHVISLIEDDNERSQRVAEKLGMKVEGRTRILDGQFEVRVFGTDLGSPDDMTAERPADDDDPRVSEEEDAAAAEAAGIGGRRPDYDVDDDRRDERWRPLEEAGEGEAEGFELAEHDLIEEASHGDERRDPEVDAFDPEASRTRRRPSTASRTSDHEERDPARAGRSRAARACRTASGCSSVESTTSVTVRVMPSVERMRSSVSSRSLVSLARTWIIALASPATVCAETTPGSRSTTRLIASPGMRPSQ